MRHVRRKHSFLTITALAAAIFAAALWPPAEDAFAQNASLYSLKDGAYAREVSGEHLKLGLNKTMVIDLPRPARDVVVSNPKKVDAVVQSSQRAYLIGMEVGQANIIFFDDAGEQIMAIEVQIERDVGILSRMYKRLIPRAEIIIESINDNIVLRGTVPNPSDALRAGDIAGRFLGDKEKVLNAITVLGKEQVALKVIIVEMQRTMLKQLGVDMQGAIAMGQTTLGWMTDNPFSIAGKALTATEGVAAYSRGSDSIAASIKAMERNGLVRTLAEPTLTAISGESAKFLAGGEFPVPVGRDTDGNIIIEFKPFGVGLSFTPLVMSEGRISLKISTEVSELTNEGSFSVAGLTLPTLKVRRANTTVELPSGGSLVMAGLISDKTKQNIDGIPGLKNLPVLGSLFRSRDFENTETELVVIVTPYTVRPVHPKKLTRPDKNFALASDIKANLLGRFNRIYGVAGRPLPASVYHGNYGFIVD